jgi:hypothetical protein
MTDKQKLEILTAGIKAAREIMDGSYKIAVNPIHFMVDWDIFHKAEDLINDPDRV